MEFGEVIGARRMVRNFADRAVEAGVLDPVLAAAMRAPSAGFTQGVDLLVLEQPGERERYWEVCTTPEWRSATRRSGMMRAPVIVIPLCDPSAYARRYAEPDKAGSSLDRVERWPVPYWWVDAAFSTMNVLLAAVDAGLGAGFLGMFRGETALLADFGVPDGHRALGSVLIGYPDQPDPPSRSLSRRRRSFDDAVHRGRW